MGMGTGYKQTPGKLFGMMGMFDILMALLVMLLYVFIETSRTEKGKLYSM